ncbi:MAG: H4MPT-linked C1 transfer pathway protein, partial [Candidatus Methylomirabilales bacterium]
MKTVIGWDIGGVNIKATRLEIGCWMPNFQAPPPHIRAASRYFEIWREKEALPSILRDLQQALGPADAMGVTMTAELSDAFRHKREGVGFVFEKVKEAFPGIPLYALDLEGNWRNLYEDFGDLIAFAATNWIAEGLMVAERKPDCLLIDIGS